MIADQKPAILPVLPQSPLLVFEGNTAGQCFLTLLKKSLDIVGMESTFTKIVGSHFVERQPKVLQRHAICVSGSPVWIQDDDRLRNSIGHATKLFFRLPDLVKGASESYLRSLAFNCDKCDAAGGLDQTEICIRRHARLGRINSERSEDLIVFRQYRLGPTSPYSVLKGNVPILLPPVWLGGDIRHDDSRFRECGSPTQLCIRGNG